ncbi:MAG: carboxymuconolactone decarboxylase family protein [Chloroflexota bacterium]
MPKDKGKNLAEQIAKERGFSRPWHGLLAARDPEFMEIYHKMAMHAFQGRNALPRKFKEIIAVCMDAVTFYDEGLRVHLRNALKAGATEDEIIEALEVSTLLGIHNLSVHLPAVAEEVEKYRKESKKKRK